MNLYWFYLSWAFIEGTKIKEEANWKIKDTGSSTML